MKLAVIGGSAASTPALFASPQLRAAARDLDVVLVGRSRRHLGAVARAIESAGDAECASVTTVDFDAAEMRMALRGCDAILIQVRCGGYAGRARDEMFPLPFGIPGDEGIGPGGLSAAWRSWPPLCDILATVKETCPRAVVLMMTSPVSLLVRCARTAFPALRTVGICELPWTTLKEVCKTVGVDPGAVSFTYAGVNHLGWFGRIACGALDVVDAYKKHRTRAAFPSAQLIESCQGIPLKYLRLHYERGDVVSEQRARLVSRGDELQQLQTHAYDVFEAGDREAMRRALDARPTPWYEEAVGPLLGAMANRATSTVPFFLSVPSRGALAGFGDDDILEIAHRFTGDDFERIERSCDLPAETKGDLERFVRFERAASRAVAARDARALAGALEDHPWVDSAAVASAIAAAIADQDDEPVAAVRSTSST
ncbi:MAG: hypothetical protein ACHQY2_03530 [Candidatus Eremiobacterales bacterium]